MSAIKTKITEDIKTAMKARDQHTLTTLRGLSAAIKQVEVDTREDVGDDKVIQIIQKEIKMRRDALGFAEQQGRDELIQQNNREIGILQAYLGAQLSEEELAGIIQELIDSGKNNVGAIMGALNASYKGAFEGRIASEIAKSKLA